MKYLIFINDSTGITDFRMELVSKLLEQGEVVVSTPDNGTVEVIEKLGARVIDTKLARRSINPISDFKLYKTYRAILKSERPNMVITYTIKPNVYAGLACRQLQVPYVANVTGLGTTFQKEGLLKNVVINLYKIGLSKAKTVFFENIENKDIFINSKIIREQQACLLNGAGVNTEYFHATEYPGGEVIKFLFVGRIMQEKGIDELFDAMRKLQEDGIKCTLDVLGSFDENYLDVIGQYEKEGWLSYRGYQNDVRPFIASCHCFVLPSWHEGMANTNLECAASARPVITSDIHGCKEAVEDGISGFLAKSKNSEDLYQVMKKFCLLDFERRRNMGLAGRRRMQMLFEKREVVHQTILRL